VVKFAAVFLHALSMACEKSLYNEKV
jgi:hypothetical protein